MGQGGRKSKIEAERRYGGFDLDTETVYPNGVRVAEGTAGRCHRARHWPESTARTAIGLSIVDAAGRSGTEKRCYMPRRIDPEIVKLICFVFSLPFAFVAVILVFNFLVARP
jgi:hypothetical protein